MGTRAVCLGFPRIGRNRELKRALEAHWAGRSPAGALAQTAAALRRDAWRTMHAAGLDRVPCNDFSFYDHVLDTALLLGAVPTRYRAGTEPLAPYFAMARGHQSDGGPDLPALEMTKWFDTNYHYLVPELDAGQTFRLDATKILAEIDEAQALGIDASPVVLGPVTFLRLAKAAGGHPGEGTLHLLPALVPVYAELLALLASRGVAWVQLDEPALVLDLDATWRRKAGQALARLAAGVRPRVVLATYFGDLGEQLPIALAAGFDAVHLDLVTAPEQLDAALDVLPPATALSLGVVDGRNVWRTDLDRAHAVVHRVVRRLGAARVEVAPSCSLLHVPMDLDLEPGLDAQLSTWLAFAVQKLDEVRALADAATTPAPVSAAFEAARAALAARRASDRTHDPAVRRRLASVDETMLARAEPFLARAKRHETRFRLPLLPTTTIGSFPQTSAVRAARADWRAGRLDDDGYREHLRTETRRCVERQESLGLDVLVHGEFERPDMVEYFGERLAGFAHTRHGWVQSYGSRCVKPPILWGDVSRPAPMTVEWSTYAQRLTALPLKGMLTGPVTILQWSFVRDDQARSTTCRQIALALRDEVADLEAAGLAMIQIDEPALREGLPLRRADWPAYLRWAVDAFRLATAGAHPDTQIHTHMCYAEFGDVLEAIAAMDADVISIETSRSAMALLDDFARFRYPNAVGPGVYDIHSPRVPTTHDVEVLLDRALRVVPSERLWVNPDCGLKTRAWPEVEAALARMVEAARRVRSRIVTERVRAGLKRAPARRDRA
ncbi:MAG: 5-methyltetrahydropteroyltriglutamate--homocysteine S-methyltransferase [bacterium]|nr:5-methyltetrahydropteroyltriglutamate--homocysteine S-methyltransferase [bacterium]